MSRHVTTRGDFRFVRPLRTPVPDADWFDAAMADYWRALALPYAAAMARLGGDLRLRAGHTERHAAAGEGEGGEVALRCDRVGASLLGFAGAVFRGGQRLMSGERVYEFVDWATQGAQPVPAPLRQLLADHEAGRAHTEVRTGDWATLGAAAAPVRIAVFVEEQGISRDDEWDEHDAGALHAVVLNALGMPVATGRLLQDAPRVARIGRMAVDRDLRGAGWGRVVIEALHRAAFLRGDAECALSAQQSAASFYQRLGYAPRGQPYDEVGIAHIGMARRLDVRDAVGRG